MKSPPVFENGERHPLLTETRVRERLSHLVVISRLAALKRTHGRERIGKLTVVAGARGGEGEGGGGGPCTRAEQCLFLGDASTEHQPVLSGRYSHLVVEAVCRVSYHTTLDLSSLTTLTYLQLTQHRRSQANPSEPPPTTDNVRRRGEEGRRTLCLPSARPLLTPLHPRNLCYRTILHG